ncbi:hypothetical protein IHV10_20265 [Fictibacillus sp. 5RED26]|uniref:hypothetical protein n=1 Tax=Fictibacillus sp. 5RED26 TaxID=2745876 RepID=UPI0018CDBDAA|nr:hypothetical protein [Fictibacillus sp. 5RED26]MBH0158722.1 hypothetical protein [Fictibacillus sp. 5RED26]
MRNEKDFKVMNFTEADYKHNDIKPSNYLIERVDSYNYVLHREVTRSELTDYDQDRLFLFQNRYYLSCIKHTPDQHTAELVVIGYWEAMKQLNRMKRSLGGSGRWNR